MLGRSFLVTAAMVAAVTIVTPLAEAADSPDSPGAAVESHLHTVDPVMITPGDELTLAGIVENSGDEPIGNVQALPRWSTVQLESRSEIRQVNSDPGLRHGIRYDDPYQVVAEQLEPGERREFELTIDADDMGLGLSGVYVVGIDIRGTLANGDRITLETVRTVVPWWQGEPPDAVDVALLWPVDGQPSLLPDGRLQDEALADRVSSGGSLDALVQAGESAPVSWLVDPDVLDTVDAMADGYETSSADGNTDGSGADNAAAWRSAFDEATADTPTFLLPYAQPDLAALQASQPGLAAELSQASTEATASAADAMEDARTGLVRPDGGAVTQDTLDVIADAGARTVVLSDAQVSPTVQHPRVEVDTGHGDLEALLTDTGLDDAIADATAATGPAAAVELRQRWAAETAMVTLHAAIRGTSPQPLVAGPPSRWRPDPEIAETLIDTWTSLPWVEPVHLTDLPESASPAAVTVNPTDAANSLPADNVDAVAEMRAAVDQYSSLLAESDPDLAQDLERATIRAASSGWRDDPAAGVAYAESITTELTDRLREVSVTVPESVTLSSRTGIFPLSVTNDLDQPVTVRLEIEAANPDRLHVDQIDEQLVESGSRQTIEIRAEAATNGRVPITVQLITADGTPLGPPHQTMVNATDYGTIGWFIIGGAGLLFGAAVIRTMIRRRSSVSDPTEGSHKPTGTEDDTAPLTRGAAEVAR